MIVGKRTEVTDNLTSKNIQHGAKEKENDKVWCHRKCHQPAAVKQREGS